MVMVGRDCFSGDTCSPPSGSTQRTRALTARFYRDQLGLPQLSSEDDEHFDAGGVRLSIHPQKEGEPPTGSDCFLVFLAEDNIERTCEELKRRGVNFLGPIQDEPFGRIAEFRDPDNKPLYIWEPPKRGSPKFPGVASLVEHYERVRNRLCISEQHSTI